MTETALSKSPSAHFGESFLDEPDPTEVKCAHMGPGLIGAKQAAFNQRHQEQGKGDLGPSLALTPQEWDAYVKAGSPKNWRQWQDAYKAEQANIVVHSAMHARGKSGKSDIRTL
jgi:hypothetical protein